MVKKYDERRLNFFYLDPSPAAMAALVEEFLAELPGWQKAAEEGPPAQRPQREQTILIYMAFFVHAAAARPEFVRVYEQFVRERFEEASMLVPILRDVGDEQSDAVLREIGQRDPDLAEAIDALLRAPRGSNGAEQLRAPITELHQLDMRWSHFFATGEAAPIDELLQLLTWPDGVRAHLKAKLQPKTGLLARLSGRRARRRETIRELAELGVRIDPDTCAVINRDDLDRFIMMTGCRQDVERFKAVNAALPAKVPAEPLVRAAMKSSAMWSLAVNGAEHPAVVAVCEQAAERFEGAALLGVLAILGHAYAQRGEFAAAHRVTARHLELDPDRVDLRPSLARFELEAQFAELRARTGDGGGEAVAPEVVTAALTACAARFRRPPTYHARVTESVHGEDWSRCEYRARFAGREHEHVTLGRWNREHDGLGDEWIRRDSATYVNPGLWARLPDEWRDRCKAPAHVRVDPFAAVAAGGAPVRAHAPADSPHLVLAWEVPRLPGFEPPGDPGPLAVALWIDHRDGWIAHARVEPAAPGPAGPGFELEAWFIAADPPFTIEAPADAIRPR
ncbi:hypothetical protein [Nannocystis punicea]|uniref:Tetratricopeptide repeat protein n=1 Tax=Nannocystis punicea TaxID=2995304 RepID=A0ABY7GZ35_9BACT|nr:hypothetical protein [Nannocystis poenicansa]WAS92212.1 hypothetical protein O0S08_39020 [Nannocystis poenicansa]